MANSTNNGRKAKKTPCAGAQGGGTNNARGDFTHDGFVEPNITPAGLLEEGNAESPARKKPAGEPDAPAVRLGRAAAAADGGGRVLGQRGTRSGRADSRLSPRRRRHRTLREAR